MLLFACKKDDDTPPEVFTKFPTPAWKADETGKYPFSMTAVVTIPEKLKAGFGSADKIGAFIKDECRGTGVVVKVDTSNVFYVLIHGTASEQEKIRFSYYSAKTSYMYTTPEFLNFTIDSNFGTPDAPQVLELTPVK